MAEVISMPNEPLDNRGGGDSRENSAADEPPSSSPQPPASSRVRQRDSRDVRDDKYPDRREDSSDKNKSSPPPPPRERDRDYKRRISVSPPPTGYRERRHSPSMRRSPPYKRSRRDDGYDGRRGSPRGYGAHDRRFGYDYGGGRDRDLASRLSYPDDRRFYGRSGYPDWESSRDASNSSMQREGLMSYKQFIQELEDDVLPSEAERRYHEYRTEYISTQKKVFFEAHSDEDWLKDKYHPTNLLSVIERRNELARKTAKDFHLDLQSGTLDVGPALNSAGTNNSDDDVDGKRRRNPRTASRESDLLSSAPKAPAVCNEPRRILIDVEQAQTLVRKLDSEKGIEENILCSSDGDKSNREKPHGTSGGPFVLVRSLTSVKGLEGVELLDTLLTYLWRIHGVDYYGMIETNEAKGLRHVRSEMKGNEDGSEWEKKLDSRWKERLAGQDPLEAMTGKEKIDAASNEALDPYVRKIRDEKYGWKYGCGAKGCAKLFHAAEFVHKHLKLKHPELLTDFTSKLKEELYCQNYMTDLEAPGGAPVMQERVSKERPQRKKMGIESRLKDDRGRRGNRERFDRSENEQSWEFHGGEGADGDDGMYGSQSFRNSHFASDVPPPVLMPVPGAGPLGPFVPAPPEVAMRMLREQGGPPFEAAPPIILGPGFRHDPRTIRSYQDLDAPEDEVTVIDYRSL